MVGLELVQFVKLQADVLDGQLEHVPEARQVLGDGPWVCVGVLTQHKHTGATIAVRLPSPEPTLTTTLNKFYV